MVISVASVSEFIFAKSPVKTSLYCASGVFGQTCIYLIVSRMYLRVNDKCSCVPGASFDFFGHSNPWFTHLEPHQSSPKLQQTHKQDMAML